MVLTHKEACKYLGVSRTTLWRLRDQGLPYRQITPRNIVFIKEEIDKWVQEREQV